MYQLECYGLYIESNTFLEDVFESFRNKCLNTCNLELTLLTYINMLLIIGSGIKGEISYSVLHRTRVIVKYKENYKNLQ